MRKSKFPEGTRKEAALLIKRTERGAETKRLQCVYLGASGLSSEKVAPIVGYRATHVRLVWKWFREGGFERLLGERRGQTRNRSHWTEREEAEFLSVFKERAEQGQIVTVKAIRKSHQALLGKPLVIGTTYNLLRRHGWRKIVPRPEHPKYRPEDAERFKEAIFPHSYDPYEGIISP